MSVRLIAFAFLAAFVPAPGLAENPAPTHADVSYGPHDRNVLDFWKADSTRATPVIVFIHGGGFSKGDKSGIRKDSIIKASLDRGISFAAINYRYRSAAPIQEILRDCARAIQFLRSKAADWNIDKTRFASYGGSAGAGTSLWLAYHDDLADPASADPVLRESTRLTCAGANSTQFTYDIPRWKELFEKADQSVAEQLLLPTFYGLTTWTELESEAGKKIRSDCDMCGLISKDDPPVFLSTKGPGGPVTGRGHLLHHPLHAKAIQDRCREVGCIAVADLPGLEIRPGTDQPRDLSSFLFQNLQPAVSGPRK
ncbi:acetyl esterase [Caulifigura coniformis]|uniref:Acetyl esterase n=1 Tax=Caulifigura coniformis TaxID=2527983 RepID=A0A517SIM9_9PLAN|nr:alpha/beta hydrolase fold domain-containing protein [Caulifigura coniformis]QDT55983.1 acetyl esterase [Caulifigura coniformis]